MQNKKEIKGSERRKETRVWG